MFHKTKQRQPDETAASIVATDAGRTPATRQEMPASRPNVSVIGSHTRVEGDIDAGEDLVVEGHIVGTITCKRNTVTLGSSAHLFGDVHAHTLHVSGEVEGNLVAAHRATIHKGANVRGAIVTPCLILEDGSTFHGSIDMDPENALLKSAFGESAEASQALASPNEESETAVSDSDESLTPLTPDSDTRQV